MTDTFKILVLGRGDFFSRYNYSTSFLIFYSDRNLLIDCPCPIRRMVYDASKKSGIPLDMHDINDVLVTHVHGDHSNGLESLGFFKKFVQGERANIYTIPEVEHDLWEHKLKAAMHRQVDHVNGESHEFSLEDYFNVHLLEPGKVNDVNGLKIVIRYTRHYVPCFGFKVGYGDSWVAYSSDTTYDPEHIEFLSDADIIFHETNLAGHTPYKELLELPESVLNKMVLVHIYDDFPCSESKIPCAREGVVYTP